MNEREKLVSKRRFKEFKNSDAWEQRKLGDLGSFKNGMNFDKSAMGHGYPFVNLQNIFGKTIVDDSDLGLAVSSEKQRNDYNLLKGDILFIRSSVKPEGVGEAALVPKNFENTTFSGFIIRFRPHIAIDDEFKRIIFATKNARTQIMALATSSANTNINQESLEKITVELPELSEQSKIGHLFKQLDETIALHQRKLDKTKAIKSAYLSEMFPVEGERKPKRRFVEFTDDWEQHKLTDEVELFSGLTYSPNNIVKGNGTLVLRSSNVKNGEVIDADNVYVNSDVVNSNNVKNGDIIVVVRNGSRSLIGKHAQIKGEKDNTVIGAFMTGLRSDHSDFINALLDTPVFKGEIDKNLGATINQITNGMFHQMKFMIPTPEEQDRVGEIFTGLDNLITLHQHKLDKLQTIKKAYLNEMFI
ncbi:type I restriction enzyme S subunit [Trichococcus patagoniensis]|uniref:Type I restriction enzyme S subunit n=1 Tax=Trichococcus patagoniensis TaxID=382641 RepID=A0A2T5IJE1_9LACT|nr:restriction endonuclease subunit S [Trichococcus patagoniensis]PTQ83945.1 type I restriction enzyme S subunit [Trichococcus patagoniensis]